MTLAGLPGQAVAAESQIPSTPEAYVAWLEAKSEPGAAETIAQFKALPAEKQKKFIGYLNAPDHFEAFMDAVESPAAKRSVLADGDIVIDREEEGGFPRSVDTICYAAAVSVTDRCSKAIGLM